MHIYIHIYIYHDYSIFLLIISEGDGTPPVRGSSEAMTVSNIVANIFIIFKELLQNMVKYTKCIHHNRLKHASFKCSTER
jgi:hypothetical protein